jgi:metal-responsive CopG/Arc/MetJ family transcriptional regulator
MKRAANKNVTLSLPELLLRRFRKYAASRNQSMSKLMAEAIRRMMDQESKLSAADRRIRDRMHNAQDLGTGGVISWTREELYERVR